MFTNVLYSTLQSTVTPRNLQYLLPPRRLATLLVGYYSRIASQPASLLSYRPLGGVRWFWPHPPWGVLLFSSREAEDPSHIPPTTHGNIAGGGRAVVSFAVLSSTVQQEKKNCTNCTTYSAQYIHFCTAVPSR